MHFTKSDLSNQEKIFRLNLINSVTGIKPANLIGTKNDQGQTNLAIFSSVIHLGSNPPLIGFISRPVGEVRRHTIENIEQQGQYTINSVPASMMEQAHLTSAKLEEAESEFEYCGFTEEYLEGFSAPFVKESPLKMGLSIVESIPIERNGTILMIGEIEHLVVDKKAISKEGYLNLEHLGVAGISGLNSYYNLKYESSFPYARRQMVIPSEA
ncbi:MAG TPA: flavin reductase [Roseivirga sp.]